MRVALYYAPERGDPLRAAGDHWLGRDPESAAPLAQPSLPGIAAMTADARRYGFHATLKPPMRLRSAWGAFLADADALAARTPPFALPPLAVSSLEGFLTLLEATPSAALRRLAEACVEALDAHRAPASDEEMARRRRGGLTPRQDEMLRRWGYPYLFESWRFHMTLTRRLSPEEAAICRPAATAHFAAALALPRAVASLAVFTEREPGAPLLLAERLRLRG